MANKKVTRKKAASNASKTLKNKSTGRKSKTASGSVLAQKSGKKIARKKVFTVQGTNSTGPKKKK